MDNIDKWSCTTKKYLEEDADPLDFLATVEQYEGDIRMTALTPDPEVFSLLPTLL